MVNLFRSHHINRALLSLVLTSFTVTYSTPLPAQQFNWNWNEAAFLVRIEKLVEKLVKSEKKGIDNMIACLVDIKDEIETSYNVKINLDTYMDQVAKEINKAGHKTPKKELDYIKKKLKGKDKKTKHHAMYVGQYMDVEGYQFNVEDEQMLYMAKHGHDKDDKDQDEKKVEVPALLVYGVTCALCGMFLMILPIPVCKDWGSRMVVAGVTACANSLCSKADENKKNEKDKK